jgi:predicted ferric reductase
MAVAARKAVTDGLAESILLPRAGSLSFSKRDPSVGTVQSRSDYSPYTYGLTGTDQPQNILVTKLFICTMLLLAFIIFLGRIAQLTNAHLRLLFTLSATEKQQYYWAVNGSQWWPRTKRYLLYAPLWKKRHNREFKLSSALNMGTLPSRFHTLLLVLYLASNLIWMCLLDYSATKPALLADLRGRSGHLAVINMLPLFLLAGRNNPLIQILKVSYDTYNLLHRWMGRVVLIESVIHTFAWLAGVIATSNEAEVNLRIRTDPFLAYGLACTVLLAVVVLTASSVFRHAFYETFLHLHLVLVLTVLITLYYHIKLGNLPQMPYLHAVAWLWGLERGIRVLRLVYRNFSRTRMTSVVVQALPGEACRVTFTMPRPWTFKPGTHVFITLPSISLWQSHPFSVAWSEEMPTYADSLSIKDMEKSESDIEGQLEQTETCMSLVVHKRAGMTANLYNKAIAAPAGQLYMRGFVEGPYGGLEKLHSYGTVVLFAGGIGITHQVPHVRDLIAGYHNGTIATRKITLVWIVRTTEHLEWVRTWMDKVLAMPGRRDVLKILLFVTKPKSPREVISPSATVQMFPGRPNAQAIIDKEINERVGAMCVTVCGPGGLADGVRQAVRSRVEVANVDFVEEAFTW